MYCVLIPLRKVRRLNNLEKLILSLEDELLLTESQNKISKNIGLEVNSFSIDEGWMTNAHCGEKYIIIRSWRLMVGFAEKESCYKANSSENFRHCGSEEKSGSLSTFRSDCSADSPEGGTVVESGSSVVMREDRNSSSSCGCSGVQRAHCGSDINVIHQVMIQVELGI